MQRKYKNISYADPSSRTIPLIDQIRQIIHPWKAGDAIEAVSVPMQ